MRAEPDPRIEQAIQRYFEAWSSRDRRRWEDVLSDDVVLHDPVGMPPAVGKAALGEIWNAIAGPFQTIHVRADDTFYGGDGAAVHWSGTVTARLDAEAKTEIEGISVFEIGEDGTIDTIMTWWDPAEALLRLAGADESIDDDELH
jgi:steroid delta-isomerase